MSRGYGTVQRGIIGIFRTEPSAKLTVNEIAEIIFGEAAPTRAQRESIRRALRSLLPRLGLCRSRIRLSDGFGWQHRYGRITPR